MGLCCLSWRFAAGLQAVWGCLSPTTKLKVSYIKGYGFVKTRCTQGFRLHLDSVLQRQCWARLTNGWKQPATKRKFTNERWLQEITPLLLPSKVWNHTAVKCSWLPSCPLPFPMSCTCASGGRKDCMHLKVLSFDFNLNLIKQIIIWKTLRDPYVSVSWRKDRLLIIDQRSRQIKKWRMSELTQVGNIYRNAISLVIYCSRLLL